MIYLDTHVVIWLYQKSVDRFSERALMLVDQHQLVISPVVLLEVEYLYEIGRIRDKARAIFDYLHEAIQLDTCSKTFSSVTRRALGLKWTRDPFDRIIVAQAALNESMLLTKDTSIHSHYAEAVW